MDDGESSFSSDASIEDNLRPKTPKSDGDDDDVGEPGDVDDPGDLSASPVVSEILPTDSTAGLWRKNAHFVSLERLLGGVAIAPRYPTAGQTGLSTCPGVIPDPPPLSRVASPFLPFEACSAAMDVEEYGRVRNHRRWWERLRAMSHISTRDGFAHATDNALRNKIRASMLRNEPFGGNSLNKRATRRPGKLWPRGNQTLNWEKSVYQEYRRLLAQNPFGPENLYSSSCLRSFVGGAEGDVCLAHTDYSRAVKIRTLRRSAVGEGTPFRFRAEKESAAELLDYDLAEDERVYGVATVAADPTPLFAVKYRRALSLMDVEGDMKGNWKSQDDLADVAVLSAQDAIASVDCEGSVRLINYDTMEVVAVWEGALKKRIRGYRWACLLEGSLEDPWKVAVGTRKAVALFDTRRGSSPRLLCKSVCDEPLNEIVTAVARSSASPASAFYVATTHGVHLLDERSLRNPVTTWRHLCGGESAVVGCAAAVVDGVEYVATHARNGDVQVLANDWRHSECRRRPKSLQLSCQKWPAKRPQYPLSRSGGRMQNIPSVSAILNEFPFDSDVPVSHLIAPWVGMTMVSEKSDELSLIASNAAGALFCCDVGLGEGEEQAEEGAAAAAASSEVDLFSVDDTRDDGKKETKRSSAWNCPPTFNDVQREWVNRWAEHCEETAYRKISRPTVVYKRQQGWAEHLAENNRVLHPIRKSWRYEQPDHADVNEVGCQKALKAKKCFKNAPMLKKFKSHPTFQNDGGLVVEKFDESEWQHDAQARRVLAIFNGENPWRDDFEMATEKAREADAESLFGCGSKRKRTWSRSSKTSEASSASEPPPPTARIEEDRNFTLDNFLAGIEANMTSTQEMTPAAAVLADVPPEEEETASAPLVASQSLLASTSSQQLFPTATTSARKKKKKKLAGF